VLKKSYVHFQLLITNAARVRERLLKLPVDSNKYNGNSVSDVISFIDAEERRKSIEISRLFVKHVNTHLSLYSRLFKYGIANKLTDTNIFENIKAGVNSRYKVSSDLLINSLFSVLVIGLSSYTACVPICVLNFNAI